MSKIMNYSWLVYQSRKYMSAIPNMANDVGQYERNVWVHQVQIFIEF